VNRPAILERLYAILAADTTLKGSDESPAGTWPRPHGPVVREWPTEDLEGTALWLGEVRGLQSSESSFGSGITVWNDRWTVSVYGAVAPTSAAEAAELGQALIDAVRTIVSLNRMLDIEGGEQIPTLRGVAAGVTDGPDRFPNPDGAGVVATVRIEIVVSEEGY